MPACKAWLKGVVDARADGQALLVTGSARMETFRQSGESLAGRYLPLRLHPVSVREWCQQQGATPDDALGRLLQRGGFPEPLLADSDDEAQRWRRQYATDLIGEDVVEFSRLHEVNTMRVFFELLRERAGSPLSLASMARDLAVSPNTLRRCLDILQALYIVFIVQPWHRNIARAAAGAQGLLFRHGPGEGRRRRALRERRGHDAAEAGALAARHAGCGHRFALRTHERRRRSRLLSQRAAGADSSGRVQAGRRPASSCAGALCGPVPSGRCRATGA